MNSFDQLKLTSYAYPWGRASCLGFFLLFEQSCDVPIPT